MKITDERTNKKKTVSGVNVSGVFRDYANGKYYIKTDEIDEELYVCVDIETGEVTNFRSSHEVEPLDAELIIRG